MYGDTTLRNVIGLHHNNLTAVHRAHSRAGAALQHAVAEKTKMYNEAMRGRLNEEVAILAIETGGRMHSQFHRLITAFARFKADKIAGPLPVDRTRQGLGFDNRTDGVYPAVKVKGDFTCARNPLSWAGSKSHESRASRKGSCVLQFRTPDAPEIRQCQTKTSLVNLVCIKTSNLDNQEFSKNRAIYVRTKSSLMGRIQVARVKTIAERIMRITMPHTRCTGNEAVSN